MDPAPLPARAVEGRLDRALEFLMRIADHQLDPAEASRHQAAEEPEPERAILTRPDVEPQHLTLAIAVDADRDHDRRANNPAIVSGLHERGIQPDIRIAAFEWAPSEPLHFFVERLAQPTDLALRDPIQPQRLHQIVDLPRRHALDVCLAHHRHQRLLAPPTGLQHGREVAPVTHARHPQPDRPDPRVPLPLAVPVPLPAPLGGPLVTFRSEVLADLDFHQGLTQHTHSVTQEIHVPVLLRLAHQLCQCHAHRVGHRCGPSARDPDNPSENHTVADFVNPPTYTLPGTLPALSAIPCDSDTDAIC